MKKIFFAALALSAICTLAACASSEGSGGTVNATQVATDSLPGQVLIVRQDDRHLHQIVQAVGEAKGWTINEDGIASAFVVLDFAADTAMRLYILPSAVRRLSAQQYSLRWAVSPDSLAAGRGITLTLGLSEGNTGNSQNFLLAAYYLGSGEVSLPYSLPEGNGIGKSTIPARKGLERMLAMAGQPAPAGTSLPQLRLRLQAALAE